MQLCATFQKEKRKGLAYDLLIKYSLSNGWLWVQHREEASQNRPVRTSTNGQEKTQTTWSLWHIMDGILSSTELWRHIIKHVLTYHSRDHINILYSLSQLTYFIKLLRVVWTEDSGSRSTISTGFGYIKVKNMCTSLHLLKVTIFNFN